MKKKLLPWIGLVTVILLYAFHIWYQVARCEEKPHLAACSDGGIYLEQTPAP